MNVIIVDDEERSRNALSILISSHCPLLKIVATAANVPDAVKAINKFKPEIVFSDIEMPNYSGLELPDFFEKTDFEIIFTTAYSEYAVKAFELSAVGYLMKPVNPLQLTNAVERAIKMRGQSQTHERLQTLKSNFGDKGITKLALSQSEGITFVNTSDIVYLKADGYCTKFYLNSGKEILVTKNLKEFETNLNNVGTFFRTHRSFIINLNYISGYQKSEGGIIALTNGHSVDLSRERKVEFEKIIATN